MSWNIWNGMPKPQYKEETMFKSQAQITKRDVEYANNNFPIGTKVHIIKMDGEPEYEGKEGVVQHIDSIGQIHGTWGGCALIPFIDKFIKID